MLYKRRTIQSEIINLCINRNVIKGDILFTDCNAASTSTMFYNQLKDLSKLNWSIINSNSWSDFDDGKRIRCSEVLVKNKVRLESIKKIVCFNTENKKFVLNVLGVLEIPVDVDIKFYF